MNVNENITNERKLRIYKGGILTKLLISLLIIA